jgi:hypothetical protein
MAILVTWLFWSHRYFAHIAILVTARDIGNQRTLVTPVAAEKSSF